MEENIQQKIIQILNMLKEIETALGEFYGRCAFLFPKDAQLWQELKGDEMRHAEQIDEVVAMVEEKAEKFLAGEFNPVALKTYLAGIKNQRDRLEKGEIGRDKAFFIARDYENTLVEKKFHRAVKSIDPGFMHLTEQIEQEEREHLEKLDDYIKSISIN
ncbi:MAG: hypothetical protein GTO17_04635 [Candidatus Aminicenantes bacterium]|nr:hypothetical protein [Candidatus Aminicenantes bacterium]